MKSDLISMRKAKALDRIQIAACDLSGVPGVDRMKAFLLGERAQAVTRAPRQPIYMAKLLETVADILESIGATSAPELTGNDNQTGIAPG